MVQGDDEHLGRFLHQGFPVVGEEQVVIGDPVAHRVIGTHGVQERREQGQGVSAWERGRGLRDSAHLPLAAPAGEGGGQVGQDDPSSPTVSVPGCGLGAREQPQELIPIIPGRDHSPLLACIWDPGGDGWGPEGVHYQDRDGQS